MSTKRAVLIAKDCRVLSNQNFGNLAGLQDTQYNSINLNQNYKCETATSPSKFFQSESKNLSDSNQNSYALQIDTVDFVHQNDYKTSSWNNKNDSVKESNYYRQNYFGKEWQNKSVEDLINKSSTLSLHIEAYENDANETQNFVDKTIGDLKKSKQDSFAIPRQQQQQKEGEKESFEAEMMAFKLSKPLLNLGSGLKDKRQLFSPIYSRAFSTKQDFQPQEGFVKAITEPIILPRLKPSTTFPFVRLLSTTSSHHQGIMASFITRVERAAPIFSRITGLIRSGQMKWENRPLWYDVYAAVPPFEEPVWDLKMPKADESVRSIMYKEDMVRAKFYSEFRNNSGITAIENSSKQTISEQFINQVEDERKANPEMTEEQLFERASNVLIEHGLIKKRI